MKRLLAMLLAAGLAGGAAAQLRSIPQEAKPGKLRHLQAMVVEIDGKPAMLSPGAQIRDTSNRIVMPATLAQMTAVKYLVDASGMVHRVWILSPQEAAAVPAAPKPKPKPAPQPAKSDGAK